MKTLGGLLVVIGILVALFGPLLYGVLIIIAGALCVLAGGHTEEPKFTCPHCGNPVAPTANLCPTCHGVITPSQGPLAPHPAAKAVGQYVGRRMVCRTCGRTGGLHTPACTETGNTQKNLGG